MTPRQKILSDTINMVYVKKIERTSEGVDEAFQLTYPYFGKHAQKYFSQMSWKSIRRLKTEILTYLNNSIILDYSDFESGGRYIGYLYYMDLLNVSQSKKSQL